MKMLRDMQRLGIGIDRRADVPVRETGAAGQLSALREQIETLPVHYGLHGHKYLMKEDVLATLAVPQSERRLKPGPYKKWCKTHRQAPPCTICDYEVVAAATPKPDWCDECNAPQMVLPNGEHACAPKPAPACEAPPLSKELRSLVNECNGILSLAEAEIAQVTGVTNLRCFKRRIDEGVRALAASVPPPRS